MSEQDALDQAHDRTPDADVTDATIHADEADAVAGHGADRMPTPEDAIERGAAVKGEGQID